jgi:hypothetical protein
MMTRIYTTRSEKGYKLVTYFSRCSPAQLEYVCHLVIGLGA